MFPAECGVRPARPSRQPWEHRVRGDYRTVLQATLAAEMTSHLGYERGATSFRTGGQSSQQELAEDGTDQVGPDRHRDAPRQDR